MKENKDDWKTAQVLPIFQKGDCTNYNNYKV